MFGPPFAAKPLVDELSSALDQWVKDGGLFMVDELKPKSRRFPNLSAVAGAIDKLGFSIEEDARKLLDEELVGVEVKRKAVMEKARARLQDRREALDELSSALDKLDDLLGDNSGDRPL